MRACERVVVYGTSGSFKYFFEYNQYPRHKGIAVLKALWYKISVFKVQPL